MQHRQLPNQYWYQFWNASQRIKSENAQTNVGRTRNSKAVDHETWARTLSYVHQQLDLDEGDRLLDLCCGNALLGGAFLDEVEVVVGVDFSLPLLQQARELWGEGIQLICADVASLEFPEACFDAVLLYFAIQHLDEKQTIELLQRVMRWLSPGGRVFIGDVPDRRALWTYLSTAAARRDFIARVTEERPKIGTWYEPEFFSSIAEYLGSVDVKVVEQPEYQINSSYRFDVLFRKHT